MAQVEQTGGGRSANVELNLVPFIDLMSVLITFLLITAVWSQVSMIQIGSSIYGKKTNENVAPPPPMADIPLRLDVKASSLRLIVGKENYEFPMIAGKYDVERLVTQLKKVKETYPEKKDGFISVADEVKYEFLIFGMDKLIQSGFSAISIVPQEAE